MQRGYANQLRQMDDNSGRVLLSTQERMFVNGIVHEESNWYNSDLDLGLELLTAKYMPWNQYHRP